MCFCHDQCLYLTLLLSRDVYQDRLADVSHFIISPALVNGTHICILHTLSSSFPQENALFQAGTHDLRLVTLAMKARIDSFTEVKKAIQNMTASLEKEQKDEASRRCKAKMLRAHL